MLARPSRLQERDLVVVASDAALSIGFSVQLGVSAPVIMDHGQNSQFFSREYKPHN